MTAVINRITTTTCIILVCISAHATNHYVRPSGGTPTSPYTNWATAAHDIQTAANASASGDTVLVTNGTYVSTGPVANDAMINVSIAITIRSVNGPDVTIVDGNYPTITNRCFYITTNVILDGLKITQGWLTNKNGGGVYSSYSVTITNCVISGNSIWGHGGDFGGGLYLTKGGTVQNCLISSNYVSSSFGSGAGIYCRDVIMQDCTISGNRTVGNGDGGGANCGGDVGRVQNCLFIGNTCDNHGGGVKCGGCIISNCTITGNSGSGGLFVIGSGSIAKNCTIYGNLKGGVCIYRAGLVESCLIYSNTSSVKGAGVWFYQGGTIRNCLIMGNTTTSSSQGGGGVALEHTGGYTTGLVQNCTIIGNSAVTNGGGIYVANVTNAVQNSIIYFNKVENGTDSNYYFSVAFTDCSYSCIAPAIAGTPGNITDNPQFVDFANGNYRLKYTSPCIDGGTTNVPYATDYDDRPHWDFNGDGTNEPDMGCYEFYLPSPVASPLYLTNTVMRGATATNQFMISIMDTTDGTTMYYSVVSSTNWITSVSTGKVNFGSTNTVVITNSSAGLSAGSHTGLVTIAPLTPDWGVVTNAQTTNVQVVLQVNPRPYLSVSPTNLTRTIIEGQNASTQTFEVWNSSQNPGGDFYEMAYTNAVNTNWLSVNPSYGVSQGEHDTIDVTYSTTNLIASTNAYTTTIRVDGTNLDYSISAENSPQTIQVSVLVQGSPTLALAPAGLTNVVSEGHKASAQEFRVWNASAEPRVDLEYTMNVQTGSAWITLTPTNGTCKDNTNTVSVTYSTESLLSGWHTGVVTVASAGSTQTVGVLMRVNATPVVSWDMTGWTNEISQGETVSAGSFQIWNGSAQPSGTLRYQLSVVSGQKSKISGQKLARRSFSEVGSMVDGQWNPPLSPPRRGIKGVGWVSLSSESGTSTGGHDTVTVTYNTAGLSAGVYTGAITAAGTDEATGDTAQGSPKSVGLKLTVKGRAALRTSVDGITNTVLENYTETNSFTLWNGSGTPRSPMAYTVTDDVTWLSVSPSIGTETDGTNTISVVFTGGTLSTGTYTGTITVDATDMLSGARATNAPKTIAVTMIITPRTPSNYELPAIRGIPYAGQTLEVDKGLWQNRERLSFAYQWQRADDRVGTGLTNIASATSTNLVVSQAEKGKYLRVKVLATDSEPWPLSATVYSAFTDVMKVRAVKGDYDGDGLTDLWFFDAIPGMWRMAYSGGGAGKLEFGNFYMEAAPGDYDGNGILDFCTYEQAEGTWYVLLRPSYELRSAQFGWSETKPVEGDYDGDGTTDIAVYWPEGGIWYILKSSTWDMEWTQFGWSETQPVPGDYDGDGATDLGLYIDGTWYIWTAKGDYWTDEFGSSQALPAPGDYDGDGITDMGVYIPSDNTWHMQISSTGEIREEEFGTSNGACIPVQGYYDHDRKCDPATVHIERDFLIWCVKRSTGGYRGQSYQVSTDRWRVSW